MAKTKYQFNPESISYEKVEANFKTKIINVLKHMASSSVLAIVMVVVLFYFFGSPKERSLIRENQQLIAQYTRLNSELAKLQNVLTDLEQRDDNIYRVIFEAEPIHSNIRKAGYGGVNRYSNLENLENSELVISTNKKIDRIARSMYVQTKSYDDVEVMVKNKFKMLASIPAIMPIAIKDFGRISSGYGWRIHPIYKTRKFHDGMDFNGTVGTPIYATGDGVVTYKNTERGYGKKIVIDHGFGYKTVYAHLNGYNVKAGQKVRRGEVIAFLGNTGSSTGPHIHYEVRKNNKTIDPINYFFNDLTADEYDSMVAYAANTGQTMD
ncbi:peptidoglycan DD-metalloendopeptidase family protein [Labilibaculum sp. A4]|uniref:Peptidoglycan DD-metalloendopeptidase family protein n=1 Tax=Labilibaculum euxinus TaxID=2686357 RepID=A0A425YH39_9BACT|nr:M23 family metallopeptidase [Labilibaculum euxinus]MDQ1769591.1 M23 family metallopeptidase [Labilibaculum euxinus]MUP36262.1 peptidoglycan DD-metalloendopeptidase family protein [Labilibaculum euxinus]MVB05467.1 peptidoglycan DD-metalloendopeptidase family protein [Labilibaculum euxinus]MWN75116.1 peptidoglycan DD-metalloendopeptidase family protein [Labilibaculum euxinus]